MCGSGRTALQQESGTGSGSGPEGAAGTCSGVGPEGGTDMYSGVGPEGAAGTRSGVRESMRPAGVPVCACASLLSQTLPSRHGRHTRAALPSHPRTSPLRERTGSFSRTTLSIASARPAPPDGHPGRRRGGRGEVHT
ncbi:hypothetical protein GCM10010287_43280 [Streptomyces variabilis]|uniref:Uncharacterized protein n=1 Tax=Streptomyces variabilis TaxID=67372 RepID=A0ABQ2U245_9ACTN|nr:hypothetical protein GCM10010265_30610 [Streptomyces griseoincarnatus]GGT64110.1 hypothetical protein GCM10010287_43280 [Streptomyces variabilis]